MDDQDTAARPTAGPDRGGELAPPPKSLVAREHADPYADRRSRPLARRAERMARPARVRMRSRKPWVLARRRLLGWKVRLLT